MHHPSLPDRLHIHTLVDEHFSELEFCWWFIIRDKTRTRGEKDRRCRCNEVSENKKGGSVVEFCSDELVVTHDWFHSFLSAFLELDSVSVLRIIVVYY